MAYNTLQDDLYMCFHQYLITQRPFRSWHSLGQAQFAGLPQGGALMARQFW